MKAFKGFNRDMTCRGFQYKEGETFETDKAELCSTGFHACERPLDVFNYYSPSESVYHEVELDKVSDERRNDDTKVVAKKIKVGARLSIRDLVNAQIEFVKEHCTNEFNAEPGQPATAGENGVATAGNYGAATAGYRGAATAGNYGAATAGNYGAATAGNYGAATAGENGVATAGENGVATAGYRGAATAGNYGAATAGNYGTATAGYRGAATAGNYGAATAGYRGAATAGENGVATSRGKSSVGKNGLAVAKGNGCKVRGGLGSILIIAEESPNDFDIVEWASAVVDGEIITADTWYRLVGGKFMESEDE